MKRNTTVTWCFLALVATLGVESAAGQTCRNLEPNRTRIGLALGGGGARGAAHIGVLKALEALRIPVDYVTGTSVGAVIGGMYATGMSATEIEEEILGIDFDAIFTDQAPRTERRFRRKRDDDLDLFGPRVGYADGTFILPDGALVGQNLIQLLQRITLGQTFVRNFDNLPMPYRAVAADVVTGDEVVLGSGDLASAMRASMSIPGAFWPVEIDGKLLIDGGIANNLPVQLARDLGADVVIAVDVSSPRYTREELTNLFDMVGQLTNLMVYKSTQAQIQKLGPDDLLLTPALGRDVGSTDFDRFALAIPVGEAAVFQAADALTRYSLGEARYAAYRASVANCQKPLQPTAFVDLNNQSDYSDEAILDRLHLRAGQAIDYAQLERDIDLIYGLGQMREVSYRVTRRDGKPGVVLNVIPDRRAPNLIEYGLTFFSNSRDNAFNLRAALLKTDIDQVGGEWRTLAQIGEEPALYSEIYKPLSDSSPYYMTARADLRRDKLSLFDGNDAIGEFLVDRAQLEVSVGKEFGNSADLAIGVRRGAGAAEPSIGDRTLPRVDFDTGQLYARFRYDHVDDLFFPNRGGLGSVELRSELTGLGASEAFDQVLLRYYYSWSLGRRHNLLLGTLLYSTVDSDAPIYGLFRAGGFGRLSGLEFNQVSGQHLAIGLAGYRYSVARRGLFPAYLGATVELGNVWDRRSDISYDSALLHASAYFGYRSPLGPLYIGLGFGESGENTFFIRLGSLFQDD